MLEKGTPLKLACVRGNVEAVEKLLKAGDEASLVAYRQSLDGGRSSPWLRLTPIQFAAVYGHKELVLNFMNRPSYKPGQADDNINPSFHYFGENDTPNVKLDIGQVVEALLLEKLKQQDLSEMERKQKRNSLRTDILILQGAARYYSLCKRLPHVAEHNTRDYLRLAGIALEIARYSVDENNLPGKYASNYNKALRKSALIWFFCAVGTYVKNTFNWPELLSEKTRIIGQFGNVIDIVAYLDSSNGSSKEGASSRQYGRSSVEIIGLYALLEPFLNLADLDKVTEFISGLIEGGVVDTTDFQKTDFYQEVCRLSDYVLLTQFTAMYADCSSKELKVYYQAEQYATMNCIAALGNALTNLSERGRGYLIDYKIEKLDRLGLLLRNVDSYQQYLLSGIFEDFNFTLVALQRDVKSLVALNERLHSTELSGTFRTDSEYHHHPSVVFTFAMGATIHEKQYDLIINELKKIQNNEDLYWERSHPLGWFIKKNVPLKSEADAWMSHEDWASKLQEVFAFDGTKQGVIDTLKAVSSDLFFYIKYGPALSRMSASLQGIARLGGLQEKNLSMFLNALQWYVGRLNLDVCALCSAGGDKDAPDLVSAALIESIRQAQYLLAHVIDPRAKRAMVGQHDEWGFAIVEQAGKLAEAYEDMKKAGINALNQFVSALAQNGLYCTEEQMLGELATMKEEYDDHVGLVNGKSGGVGMANFPLIHGQNFIDGLALDHCLKDSAESSKFSLDCPSAAIVPLSFGAGFMGALYIKSNGDQSLNVKLYTPLQLDEDYQQILKDHITRKFNAKALKFTLVPPEKNVYDFMRWEVDALKEELSQDFELENGNKAAFVDSGTEVETKKTEGEPVTKEKLTELLATLGVSFLILSLSGFLEKEDDKVSKLVAKISNDASETSEVLSKLKVSDDPTERTKVKNAVQKIMLKIFGIKQEAKKLWGDISEDAKSTILKREDENPFDGVEKACKMVVDVSGNLLRPETKLAAPDASRQASELSGGGVANGMTTPIAGGNIASDSDLHEGAAAASR